VIDLTGNFSRVDGQAVYRYVPWLPSAVVDYLKAAVQDGHSDQVRIRLKGDLSDFPFAERSKGVFQVRARLKDVKFRFAQSWPELADVAGELELEGRSLRVAASQAAMQGVRIRSVRAAVPDLFNGNEHLRVEGEAEDQTADFLRFVEASPVSGMLDGFTRGMRAAGNGRLQIQLDIPLRRLEQVKLAGSYQFLGNQLRINEELPPLTQVTGRLEFTESAVNARAITAQFLGGPMTVAVATREGVIAVNANGTANATAFPQTWGGALRKRVSGGTAWQAGIAAGRGRPVTLLVESQLAGVAIDLPAPFSKRPSEPMAFRLECVLGPEGQAARRSGQMKIALGRAVSAHILGERRGDQFVLERGVIAFNEPAVLTEREGISVTGSLQYVDLDRWRVLLADGGDGKRAGPALVTLKVDTLDFAGKRFHEVALRARTVGTAWAANVAAKELAGDITWRPEGRGRVIARLKHFIVPDNVPGAPSTEAPSREMPAFDVVADSFTLRNMNFGRLELAAINEDGQDWRIEKLVLANEDSNLSASGTWQSWKEKPTVNVDLKLEVNDVGKYLERIGFPGTMQRGTATLEGKLGWEGAPSSVDYPTLRGNLSLNAAKGQFLRADPGVAKLLGILSLQSWVTLDFRDLFAKGFAFDSASGSATVASGVLATQDFRMRGASAQVSMRGTVHLVHETQDLYLRVVPSLGDTAAWIPAIMINPVWGLGTLVLQRILKDPLGQILAFEYHATGSWEKPQVERVRAEVRSADVGAP
jgi:uncharacterized protein (TIGR02099 family)